MIKGGDDRVVDWIWRLCNMSFENDVLLEDWSSFMIVSLYSTRVKKKRLNVGIIEVLAY